MAGMQLKSCSFRKGYFRYPSKRDFSLSNSTVAEPTIPTVRNIWWWQRGDLANFTKTNPLLAKNLLPPYIKTKVIEKLTRQFSIP